MIKSLMKIFYKLLIKKFRKHFFILHFFPITVLVLISFLIQKSYFKNYFKGVVSESFRTATIILAIICGVILLCGLATCIYALHKYVF